MCDSVVQRIPLAGRAVGEGPTDPFGGQPRRDMGIGINKQAVVVIQQQVIERLSVDDRDRHEQQRADGPSLVGFGSRKRAGVRRAAYVLSNRVPGRRESSRPNRAPAA